MIIAAIILTFIGLALAIMAGNQSAVHSGATPSLVTVAATLVMVTALAMAYAAGKANQQTVVDLPATNAVKVEAQ